MNDFLSTLLTPTGGVTLTATLTCAGLASSLSAGATTAQVARVDGEDRLGHGFRFDVDVILNLASAPGQAPAGGGGGGGGGGKSPARQVRDAMPKALIGQLASLALTTTDSGTGVVIATSRLGGCVTGFSFLGTLVIAGSSYQLGRFRLQPRLARWELDRGNDLFAATNPVDALRTLLTRSGGPGFSEGTDFSLGFIQAADHAARQQIVRWQESTAACITRLCEEEGIHSFYVHKQDGSGTHTLVFSEINQHQSANAGTLAPFSEPVATVTGAPLSRLSRQRLDYADGPESTRTIDQDCSRFSPKLDTSSSKLSSDPVAVDRSAALGNPPPTGIGRVLAANPGASARVKDGAGSDTVGATGIGALIAGRAAEESAGRMRRLHARGDHIALQAGTVMTLQDGGNLDGDSYLVVHRRLRLLPALAPTTPRLQGQEAAAAVPLAWPPTPELDELPADGVNWTSYNLHADVLVEAIPLELPFRPTRSQPAPVLAGTHFATVVFNAPAGTPAGDHAGAVSTDALGRVQVQFDWAPAGQVSGWIRVAQGARGMIALPRVGDRVAVTFAYGDPGRALVTGVVLDKNTDLPGDPSSATGSLGRTVLGGLWTGLEGTAPTNSRLARANDFTPCNDYGDGYLQDSAAKVATATGGSYLAFDDQLATRRGIDLFSAGMMRQQVGGDLSIKVGHKLVIEAGGSIEFQVGSMNLAINRAGVSIMYLGKNVPIKSEISLSPFQVTIDAPVVDITGTLSAGMSSATSSISARLATVQTSGVDVAATSGLSNLLGLVGTAAQMVVESCADEINEIQTETPGDKALLSKNKIAYFVIKEFMIQVKDISALVASAYSLGLSPLDTFGAGTSECILGGSFMYAKPFESVKKYLKENKGEMATSTLDALVEAGETIGTRATLPPEPFPTDRLAEEEEIHKAHTSDHDKVEMGAGYAGALLSGVEAVMGLAEIGEAAENVICNRIGVKGMSGVEILGSKKDEVLLSKDTFTASDKRIKAVEDNVALKADKTALAQTDQALSTTKQAVKQTAQSVQAVTQAMRNNLDAIEDQNNGLTVTEVHLSMKSNAAAAQMGNVITQLGP
ncbi:MAG: phage baseplate assembly protein V [Planctomycetes bacterium]|nr:phage baseplate assembly protein V [Planctomycetota bacterium]